MTDHTDDATASGEADADIVERIEALEAENERLRERLQEDNERLRERLSALKRVLGEITDQGLGAGGRVETADGTVHFDGGSNDYKVLGSLKDSNGGIGVLGRNTASNGTTYGVKGETADSGGNGLYTPDDVEIGGALDGNLTGNTPIDDLLGTHLTVENGTLDAAPPPLPELSTVGNDPRKVDTALSGEFGATGWSDPAYADGPSYSGNGQSFRGAVRVPGGKVVLVPFNAEEIAVYDPRDETVEAVDSHGQGSNAFWGGALASTGEVIFAPHDASNVGVYDPITETYSDGPKHGTSSSEAFAGAVVIPSGEVAFVPFDAGAVGLYDPANGSFSTGPSSSGTSQYIGSTLTRNGDVMFAPFDADKFGLYDPDNGTLNANSNLHYEGDSAFAGATTLPDGRVVLAPFDSSNVVVTNATGTSKTAVSHGENSGAFVGSTLLPTGEVLFVPFNAANVGLFDPATDTYTSGPSHGRSTPAFTDAALTLHEEVVLSPESNDPVGLVGGTSGIETNPLLNNS